jgi:hypothetical protein
LDCETPPIVRRKLSEISLLNDFNKAKGSRDEITRLLSLFEGNLQTIRDPQQKSLLHIACEDMDFIVVKLLVEKYKLGVNIRDATGNTPLHVACLNQKAQTVLYLSKLPSCDPNVRNSDGLTPLHIVAESGPGIIISHLVSMPALDRTLEDEEGRTAISIIQSDPKLAPSLDRKRSTASIGTFSSSSRRSSEVELGRKGRGRSGDWKGGLPRSQLLPYPTALTWASDYHAGCKPGN